MEARVITSAEEMQSDLEPARLPALPPAVAVLMVAPDHYDVAYAINPHMRDASGALRRPDRTVARSQWETLRRTYESLGYPVHVLAGVEGLPDMVFAANQAFPFPLPAPTPGCGVLPARMRHPERQPEVAHVLRWFAARGAEPVERPPEAPFLEGHGDLLWYPGRRLVLGGFGFRTERRALDEVARVAGVPVAALALQDERFYHLDTCLCPLDGARALWVPSAFDGAGSRLLARLFPRLLEAPEDEATSRLAANAHCPDGRNVIVDAGAEATIRLLRQEGFRVHPVDTSEFLKAGGSVFCLKMMLFA